MTRREEDIFALCCRRVGDFRTPAKKLYATWKDSVQIDYEDWLLYLSPAEFEGLGI